MYAFFVQAQTFQKIRFAKDRRYVYFFQTGKKSDTLKTANDHLFYYIVPDSLKNFIVLHSENANFVVTANDSIVRCNYVLGIQYETFYSQKEGDLGISPLQKQGPDNGSLAFYPKSEQLQLRCGANGSSTLEPKKILIEIVDKRNNQVILTNVYVVP